MRGYFRGGGGPPSPCRAARCSTGGTPRRTWLASGGRRAEASTACVGSLRRKFATELKHAPLRDVAHLGEWKSVRTLVSFYQQPDAVTQRALLAQRKELRARAI